MKNLFSLQNKAIVVFGGTGYIGQAVVRAMLDHDGKVVVADINEQAFESPGFADLKTHPNCRFIKCDILKNDDIRAAYSLCTDQFGFFNAMVNLVSFGKYNSIEESSDEEIAFSLAGNISHVFRATREVVPYFEKNGGVIVNTSSMYGISTPDYRIYGTSGQNNPPAYGMSKAAVINFTSYSAANLAKYGIRVNAVAPGPVPDPAKNPPPDFIRELEKKTMFGRFGQPEDMAGAFIYLVSDASAFTTAEVIVCDGGWTKW
jgi:gluconate 5-dehydrogenase